MTDGYGANHHNNFGSIRFLLASMVVICHANYLLDGNMQHDPLFWFTHAITLGDIAVDGFFIVSGYLVLQSLIRSRSRSQYVSKRARRIIPGYVVACVVSLGIGGISGGSLSLSGWIDTLVRMLFLNCVSMDHPFSGLHVVGVNGSLWSVAYEFRCYMLLLLISMLGVTRNKKLMAVLVAGLLIWATWYGARKGSDALEFIIGTAGQDARTCSLFGIGCLFYLFRDRIRFTAWGAGFSSALLLLLLRFQRLDILVVAICGGYLLFWYAFAVKPTFLSEKANETDLSYGVYLYAWPVTSLIIWYCQSQINRWQLCGVALLGAALMAWLSWTFVERPALQRKWPGEQVLLSAET